MTIYAPSEGPHRVETKCTVFKNISIDLKRFCDEKQKRVQKRVQKNTIFEYKEYIESTEYT
jgi:hypothetical protein